MVILDLTVLHSGAEVKVKIGDPQHLSDVSKKAPAATNTVPSNNSTNNNGVASTSSRLASNNSSASNSTAQHSTSNGSTQYVTCPIASLTPYQNKWVIKARVTSKTNIRTWSNARGEGKLFSMDLMDESGEIRATCFNDACDKYYEMIQVCLVL